MPRILDDERGAAHHVVHRRDARVSPRLAGPRRLNSSEDRPVEVSSDVLTPERDQPGGWGAGAAVAASTRSVGPATKRCSVLRKCDTVPTFTPAGLWMPICAPT